MIGFFGEHRAWFILGAFWFISWAADSIPPLPKGAGFFQRWAYNALHILAANLSRVKLLKS